MYVRHEAPDTTHREGYKINLWRQRALDASRGTTCREVVQWIKVMYNAPYISNVASVGTPERHLEAMQNLQAKNKAPDLFGATSDGAPDT